MIAGAATIPAAEATEPTSAASVTAPPNVVLIFIDDMGYADIGPFGATAYPTPNLDRMAAQGKRFTDFVTSSAVCSASRAGLMTGCYHQRIGIDGALGPGSEIGIGDRELTLAELCRSRGYATACFGKWHLGHHPRFLPTRHGFDRYFGIPYSNDMWPLHPENVARLQRNPGEKSAWPPLPLLRSDAPDQVTVLNPAMTPDDQKQMTR
ncbi:MAG: arylsulfatase, partial [Planctomycetaceae bacterium]